MSSSLETKETLFYALGTSLAIARRSLNGGLIDRAKNSAAQVESLLASIKTRTDLDEEDDGLIEQNEALLEAIKLDIQQAEQVANPQSPDKDKQQALNEFSQSVEEMYSHAAAQDVQKAWEIWKELKTKHVALAKDMLAELSADASVATDSTTESHWHEIYTFFSASEVLMPQIIEINRILNQGAAVVTSELPALVGAIKTWTDASRQISSTEWCPDLLINKMKNSARNWSNALSPLRAQVPQLAQYADTMVLLEHFDDVMEYSHLNNDEFVTKAHDDIEDIRRIVAAKVVANTPPDQESVRKLRARLKLISDSVGSKKIDVVDERDLADLTTRANLELDAWEQEHILKTPLEQKYPELTETLVDIRELQRAADNGEWIVAKAGKPIDGFVLFGLCIRKLDLLERVLNKKREAANDLTTLSSIEDDILSLEELKNSIQLIVGKMVENWILNLESREIFWKELADLKARTTSSVSVGDVKMFEDRIELARQKLVGREYSPVQKEQLILLYINPSEKKLEEIKQERENLEIGQKLHTWEVAVKDLVEKVREATQVDLANIAPHSVRADAKTQADLETLENELQTLYEQSLNGRFFDSQLHPYASSHIELLIGSEGNAGAYGSALENLHRALEKSRAKTQDQLQRQELAKRLRDQFQALEFLCRSNDINIRPIDWENIRSEADLNLERARITREMYAKIIGRIVGSLGDVGDYMIASPFNMAAGPKFDTMDPNKRTYTLIEIFSVLPTEVRLNFGGGENTYKLLPELKFHIDALVNMGSRIFDTAVLLKSYSSESEYIKLVTSKEYIQGFFDRANLRRLLLYETTPDSGLLGAGLSPEESIFPCFRSVLTKLYELKNFPQIHADRPSTKAALEQYQDTVGKYNCFPLEHQQDTPIADPSQTYEWVKQSVGGGMSDTMFELAFRMAFAYLRATGQEENFDLRPKLKDGENEITFKTFAFRKASAIFHTLWYTLFSIDSKGSGRNPVSVQFAERHPSLALPSDESWIFSVQVSPGVVERMSVAKIIEENLWGRIVDDKTTFPVDPSMDYAAWMQQVSHHLDFWKMGEKAQSMLPTDPAKLTNAVPAEAVRRNYWLADVFAKVSISVPVIEKKIATELLERLWLSDRAMYDRDYQTRVYNDTLFTIDIHQHAANPNLPEAFKNCAEYYLAKLPKTPEVVKKLFKNKHGNQIVLGIEAYQAHLESGNDREAGRSLNRIIMAIFLLTLRAELERYAFKNESLEQAHHEMEGGGKSGFLAQIRSIFSSNRIDLSKSMETIGNKHPLTYVQRRAIEKHLLQFFEGLDPSFKEFAIDVEGVRQLFKSVGIEGNAAANYYDLKWMLTTDEHPLRKAVKARSSEFFGITNGFTRFLQKTSDIIARDEAVK